MPGAETWDDRELFYWLALRLAPGIGAVRFARLLEHFKSPSAVFQRSAAAEIARFPGLPPETIAGLTRFDWGRRAEAELKRARGLGVALITMNHPAYPPRLKAISHPPPVLWVKGELRAEDRDAVAIVGSRLPTEYGRETSTRLAGELASVGICVVSGLALGIDAAAHHGALEAGGRTVGVLGCGVDMIYPLGNRDLFERVPRSGAIISDFPLGTPPRPGHFPIRNRIIAGLSLAVVVVEAAARSGALITARLALEENREVLAVPGRAGATQSQGTHALLKAGAGLVETGQEILDEIRSQLGQEVKIPFPSKPVKPAPNLSADSKMVWEALGDEPVHMDVICRRLGRRPAELSSILLEMELKGFVRQWPGMRYTREI